jgi:uncharacterized membrane protein YkvA (DUF1232 family)
MKIFESLKQRATQLKNEILALGQAFKDERTPLLAKILVGLTLSYAVSPIDIIPDFIPVLGYLDDLIILPALIALSIKLLPKEGLEDCRAKVKDGYIISRKMGWIAASLILLFWAEIIGLLIFKLVIKK